MLNFSHTAICLLNILYSLGYIPVGLELEHIMLWYGKKLGVWKDLPLFSCFNPKITAKVFIKQKFYMKKEIVLYLISPEDNKKKLLKLHI